MLSGGRRATAREFSACGAAVLGTASLLRPGTAIDMKLVQISEDDNILDKIVLSKDDRNGVRVVEGE